MAARYDDKAVDLHHFEKAIDRVIGGLEKKNKVGETASLLLVVSALPEQEVQNGVQPHTHWDRCQSQNCWPGAMSI